MKRYQLILGREGKGTVYSFKFGTTSSEQSLIEEIQELIDTHDDLPWDTHPENKGRKMGKLEMRK